MRNFNVLTATDYGPMVINRYDDTIGLSLSATGAWEKPLHSLVATLLTSAYGVDAAIDVVDAGANIGVCSLALARLPQREVRVFAIEAQRLVFQ